MGRTTPAYRCGGSRGFRAKGGKANHARHRIPVSPAEEGTRGGHLLADCSPRRDGRGRTPVATGPPAIIRALSPARLPRIHLPPRGRAVAIKAVAKKLFIRTFGCQMNEYDSDKMADVLHASDGLTLTDRPEDADVILFNTCSVREKAQERVFHDLGPRARTEAREPRPRHRRRRLRRVAGRRRHRPARALCRHRVRPADAAPAAAADRGAPRDRSRRRSTSAFPRSRSSTTCRRRAWKARRRSCRSWRAAASTARSASCPTRAARKCRARSTTC